MKLFKIIDKYRPNTIALIRSTTADEAIKKYRRLTNDYDDVIAIESHISLKSVFPALMLLLQILFIGCGSSSRDEDHIQTNQPYNGPITVDEQLRPYLDYFTNHSGLTMTDVSIELTDNIGSGHAGECITYSNGKKLIKIAKTYWGTLPEGFRIQLFFHESGHCRLGLGHNDSMGAFDGYSPRSIMYSINFNIYRPGYSNSEYIYTQALVNNQLVP